MKSKITLLSLATAAIFSSCSRESYFTSSGNYGGYHKTETMAAAPSVTNPETTPEANLTASTEVQPAAFNQTPAFTTTKQKPAEVKAAKTNTLSLAKAVVTHKKEIKAIAKAAKREAKEAKDPSGLTHKQIIAAVLAAILGLLGVHRFYLGYVGIGLIQLLLTIIGIFLIIPLFACLVWVIIDFIRILTGNLTPKNGSY